MQVHMEWNFGKHIDGMCRFTAIVASVLTAMLISISSANASSVSDFSDKSDNHSGATDYFKFGGDDRGATNAIDSHTQINDKTLKDTGDSGDGYNAIVWGNHDSPDSSHNSKDDSDNSHYKAPHDGIHGDISWVPDHDKYINHDNWDSWRNNDHKGDRHDFWDDKYDRCDPPAAVPVPGAIWLFCSGFIGLLPLATRRNRNTENSR